MKKVIIFSLFILLIYSLLLSEEILFFDDFEDDIVGQPPTNWYPDSTGSILVIDDDGNNCLLIEEDSKAILQNFNCPYQYTIQLKWKAQSCSENYSTGIEIAPWLTFYYGFHVGPGLYITDFAANCLYVEYYSYSVQPGEWYYLKLRFQDGSSDFKIWHCDELEPDYMISYFYGDITLGFCLFSLGVSNIFDEVTIYGNIYDEFEFIIQEEHLFPEFRRSTGLCNDDEYLWFKNSETYCYNPQIQQIINTLTQIDDFTVRDLTYYENYLWLIGFVNPAYNYHLQGIIKVSPETGAVLDTLICPNYPHYPLSPPIMGLANDEEYFYYSCLNQIFKLDPDSNTLIDSFYTSDLKLQFLEYYDGKLYVQSYFNELIFILNADNGEIEGIAHCDYPDGYWPCGITVLNNEYWIACGNVWPYGLEGELTFYKCSLSPVTNIEEDSITQIENVYLSNYPNPFNPSGAGRSPTTTIFFTAEDAEDAEISIYNIKGQKVKTLECDESLVTKTDGHGCSILWNGKDENNNPVGSGIYFYQLKVDGQTKASKKMLLLK